MTQMPFRKSRAISRRGARLRSVSRVVFLKMTCAAHTALEHSSVPFQQMPALLGGPSRAEHISGVTHCLHSGVQCGAHV